MSIPGSLARLLSAVIMMIAACIGASVVGVSSAQAHQGHAHHGGEAASPAPDAVFLTLAEARSDIEGLRLTVASSDEAPVARPCNGLCCLMGASCCVPGLLPDGLAAFPGPTSARRLAADEDVLPPGIAPDSPARPPRTFA